ncbi:TIGR00282 family metallophosphoesterase [Pelagibacteraceae bacterium]|jgi:2',3'-cyclic-nucleotide 2'-phosphodiesterase|nr:TIGR00282 family metallophosphoesterase [Pelagibacteraceae bacterium]
MKLLILGDVMGLSGRDALKDKLPKIIIQNKIDFVIVNGENAADDGRGITQNIAEEFFSKGVDVITSGNHIWDKQETTDYIDKENRLLRPANLAEGSPGRGFEIYITKNKKYKIGVINLMGNVFMRKTDDVFQTAKKISTKLILKKNVDFLIIDFHGEITSEKMAMGHFFDGLSTCVVGTHTHVPTADTRILEKGTAYQTDIGMCGDYDSVIGMNKENSVKKFLKDKNAIKHFPAEGEGTLSGIIVETDLETGLAKQVTRLIDGGCLVK